MSSGTYELVKRNSSFLFSIANIGTGEKLYVTGSTNEVLLYILQLELVKCKVRQNHIFVHLRASTSNKTTFWVMHACDALWPLVGEKRPSSCLVQTCDSFHIIIMSY